MPNAVCHSYVRGKRLRATLLDECGTVVTGACSQVVTDGFITIGLTSEIESGDEFIQKNANGDLCVNSRSADQFKRWNIEGEFCDVDPDLFNLMTGFPLEDNPDSEAVGFRVTEGNLERSIALELWLGTDRSDCSDGVTYGYILLPFVVGFTLGDLEVANSAINFTLNGAYTKGNGAWGSGPYDVVETDMAGTPGPLPVAMANGQHMLVRSTEVAPPTASCGCAAV